MQLRVDCYVSVEHQISYRFVFAIFYNMQHPETCRVRHQDLMLKKIRNVFRSISFSSRPVDLPVLLLVPVVQPAIFVSSHKYFQSFGLVRGLKVKL